MTIATEKKATKLYELSARLNPKIENAFAKREENTPKRQSQASGARMEGYRLKRTQEALNALAAMWRRGSVPEVFKPFVSMKSVYDRMGSEMTTSQMGFYNIYSETGKPSRKDASTQALWELLGEKSEEEVKADALRQEVNSLQFAKIPGYFPTPEPVIEMMMDKAGWDDFEVAPDVLEPSAGDGAILDYLRQSSYGMTLDCFEINDSLCKILKSKNYNVIGYNFMDSCALPKYDLVLMNPPFENLQDCNHVVRGYQVLREEGRLVAIMSPGPFFRECRKAVEFRAWFNEVGGMVEDLPAGSFKESGTMVNSKLVFIQK